MLERPTQCWFAPLFRPWNETDQSISQPPMPTGLPNSSACHSPASPGTLCRNQGKMSRSFQNRTTIATCTPTDQVDGLARSQSLVSSFINGRVDLGGRQGRSVPRPEQAERGSSEVVCFLGMPSRLPLSCTWVPSPIIWGEILVHEFRGSGRTANNGRVLSLSPEQIPPKRMVGPHQCPRRR
jgi:hypothetical protein